MTNIYIAQALEQMLFQVFVGKGSARYRNVLSTIHLKSFIIMQSLAVAKVYIIVKYSRNCRPRARSVLHRLDCGAQTPATNDRHQTAGVCAYI